MARILLSAYACEPGRGSEPGVGWSWAAELARQGHRVTVVTRCDNRLPIEREQPASTSNLKFIYYDLPQWVQHCRRYPGGKPLYYVLWQYFVVRHLRRMFPSLPFDVMQHVTYVSARFPSFLGSLGLPFLFGPVSGGESVPPPLRSGFSIRQRARERLRDLSNWLVSFDPLMCRTFRQAERILVTRDTFPLVRRCWRPRAAIRLAIALADPVPERTGPKRRRHPSDLHLLYVGRLLEWKGLAIALHAVSRLRQSHPETRFTIVGQGPAKPKLVELTRKLDLERTVRWLDWLPQRALAEHYREADLLLYPSLRDSGGMVVLEALSHGLPVVCTDLGGPGIIVNSTCGRAVATSSRTPDLLAEDIAAALHEIASVPNRLESLSYGATVRARNFSLQKLVQSVYPSPRSDHLIREA